MAAPPPPPPPAGTTTSAAQLAPRTKSKAYQTTIAAEADDLKYESKYKELKKKVKEVEEDNEQLYVKILQAQQSIQRLRVERALIYERLGSLAPPPAVPAPSQSHGGYNPPSADDGSQHHHSSHPGGASGGGGGGGASSSGAAGGGHHPHPLSQSFTASSLSHRGEREMERDVLPPISSSSNGHPSSHRVPPISPHTREQRLAETLPSSIPSAAAAATAYSPTRGVREEGMHVPHHPKPREKTTATTTTSSSVSTLPPISSAVGVGGFADGGRSVFHHPLPQTSGSPPGGY